MQERANCHDWWKPSAMTSDCTRRRSPRNWAHTPKDTRTPQQRQALRTLVSALQHLYPHAALHGHNNYAAKACPSFRVETDL